MRVENLMHDVCPICGDDFLSLVLEIRGKTVVGQTLIQKFRCGLTRRRLWEESCFGDWTYDHLDRCSGAQKFALKALGLVASDDT